MVSVVKVVAGPAKSLTLTGLPGTDIAGTSLTATATTFDAFGNQATGYLGTVHFGSNDSQASLPLNYSFTATDAGSHSFTVVLKTVLFNNRGLPAPTTVSATDIAASSLTGSQQVTVSPAPVAKVSLLIPNNQSWGAGAFDLGPVNNCNFNATDAFSNQVTTTVTYSSTDPRAKVGQSVMPAQMTTLALSIVTCNLYTAGPQTITITDVDNPSVTDTKSITCLGPVANPYNITIMSPQTQGGVTLYALNPVAASHSWNDFSIAPGLVKVDQLTYSMGGAIHQMGVTAITADNRVLWDLNPPAGTTASVPGATLVTCTPTGLCPIASPLTANYTIVDSFGNTASNTITAQISSSSNVVSAGIIVLGSSGFVVPGSSGVVGQNLNPAINTPLNITGNVVTIPFSTSTQCPAATAHPPCSLQTSANLVMPANASTFALGSQVTGLDLTQQLQVQSYYSGNHYTFAAVTVIDPAQPNAPSVFESQLYNIGPGWACFDRLGNPIPCADGSEPSTHGFPFVGESVDQAYSAMVNFLYNPVSDCHAPPAGYTGQLETITGIPQAVVVASIEYVTISFYSFSCPTNW
jgi:hypothetical protein